MLFTSALLVASLLGTQATYTDEALADQITDLPGAENLDINFNQFSGYLTVDGTKQMHYWFVESMNDPANSPVAFWTNGGPGCSGLLGFLTEQGPFRPNKDMSLSMNEYAWNQVANMVFIESPCGVGYSYSTAEDTTEDYKMDDAETAEDNYDLIQAFMKRFPEYSSNSMYISSESYGGHYMPTLAKKIVDMNTAAVQPKLNFKGFAVGNPYTDPYSGTPAMFDTFWGHQLLPKPTYDAYLNECVNSKKPNVKDCVQLQIEMNAAVGDLNPYALDYPVCTSDSTKAKGRAQRTWLMNSMMGKLSPADRKAMGVLAAEEYEPCEDDYAQTYLNLATVKAAIHVQDNLKWEPCSYTVSYNVTDSTEVSTAPIYNYLIDGDYGLNILVYSGDDDSVCGTIGTQNWIWDLGYSVAGKAWQTYTYNEQTAGYATQWKNTKLGFLTVHGAGHEVPTYKPDVALDMWVRFLAGEFTSA